MLILALLISLRALAGDGPYVMRDADRLEVLSVADQADGPHKVVGKATVGARISVPAVDEVPAFQVTLRPPAELAPDVATSRKSAPIYVVADTHGEYQILAAMLMKHGVIDASLRWSFGKGQLVVLGDVFDRGAHQTEILWLLYELEAQARKKGGAVHLVLGNHELMVLGGDLRYLNRKYLATAQVLGVGSYAELFRSDSVLGQWLRSRPAVLKLNDLLFLHGGISPRLVDMNVSRQQVNASIRAVMNQLPFASEPERERAAFLLGEDGPLWYRGYFAEPPATATPEADIPRMLAHFGVSRILVGHTRVPTITPLYDGRVIAVQVYPRRTESGAVEFETLIIRGGGFYRARPDGSTERLP
jgi:Calcineurin-like phosphoesterase